MLCYQVLWGTDGNDVLPTMKPYNLQWLEPIFSDDGWISRTKMGSAGTPTLVIFCIYNHAFWRVHDFRPFSWASLNTYKYHTCRRTSATTSYIQCQHVPTNGCPSRQKQRSQRERHQATSPKPSGETGHSCQGGSIPMSCWSSPRCFSHLQHSMNGLIQGNIWVSSPW